jgi:hypothetical protein
MTSQESKEAGSVVGFPAMACDCTAGPPLLSRLTPGELGTSPCLFPHL